MRRRRAAYLAAGLCIVLLWRARCKEKKKERENVKGSENERGTQGPPSSSRAAKPDSGYLKIIDVLRFTGRLSLDLLFPSRMRGPTTIDPTRRLLGIVWPFGEREKGRGEGEEKEGEERIRARVLILALVVLSLGSTAVQTYTIAVATRVNRAVFSRDRSRFLSMWLPALIAAALSSLSSSLTAYCTDSLALLWRLSLSRSLHKGYFSHMAYYRMPNHPNRPIRDADQRVTREVMSVTKRLASITATHILAVPKILWFTYKLWTWRGGAAAVVPHLWLLLAYEVAQRLFPKNIGSLYRSQAASQAAYSRSATRSIHTHAESIASLGGAEVEKEILLGKFSSLLSSSSSLHLALSHFGLIFKLAYIHGSQMWLQSAVLFPLLPSTPPSSPSSLSPSSSSSSSSSLDVLSSSRLSFHLLIEMLVANGGLLTNHAQAGHMISLSQRLVDMIQMFRDQEREEEEGREKGKEEEEEGEGEREKGRRGRRRMREREWIEFKDVDVITPTGVKLVEKLSFRVGSGNHLLLTGRNGAGKSSIFRCLGGLWDVPGMISKPGNRI